MKTFPTFTLLLSALLLAGCGLKQSKQDAEQVITRHFQTLATNGYTAALADYSPQFFQKTTKEEWSKSLAKLNERLGPYQSHSVTSWRLYTKAGTRGAGTTAMLQCEVIYSKRAARENFTLFKGVTDSGFKIVAHGIDGAALLQD